MPDLQANSRIRMRMLRYFQILAEELHFGRAAARLNISQPPLSVQIKELEEILGVALFERTSRKVVLTRAGAALKNEVDRILSSIEHSFSYVRQIGRSEKHHINIGIVSSALWGTLLMRLKAFRQQSPDVSWTLQELSQQQQIEALRTRTIDIAISRNVIPYVETDIRCRLLSSESMMVAVPEQERLGEDRQPVALAALRDYPVISLSFAQSDFARQVYDACQEYGFVPRITHQVYEPQTALALVSAGSGVALLPETCALIHWPGVRFLKIKESIPADLYAHYWPDATQSGLAEQLLHILCS